MTKIWGFTYMVSFTVFEAFIWLVPREKRDLAPESRSPDSRQQILISSGPTWPIEAGFFTAMVLSIMMCMVTLYTVLIVVDNKLAAIDSNGLILSAFLVLAWAALLMLRAAFLPPVLEWLDGAYPDMLERLMVVKPIRQWNRPAFGTIEGLPLQLFIVNVELSLLTYLLAYDPSTTRRATWADVLG